MMAECKLCGKKYDLIHGTNDFCSQECLMEHRSNYPDKMKESRLRDSPKVRKDYHEELTKIHYIPLAADVLRAHSARVESGLLVNVLYAFKYLLRLGIKNDNPRKDVFKALNHLHFGLYGKWLDGHDVDDSCNSRNH